MKNLIKTFILFFVIYVPAYSSDIRIETIGFMSGQNIYITYLALGFLYDSYEKGVYDAGFTSLMVKEINASCKKSKINTQDLLDKKVLTGNDEDYGKNIIDTYDTLMSEANSINSVIESGNSDTVKQFERNKSKTWDKIQTLLNIE